MENPTLQERQDYDAIDRMVVESRELLSAIDAINELDKWIFMRTYEPPINVGYMFDNNSTVLEIISKIVEYYPGHSGVSIAMTMRTMSWLAKHGARTLNYLRRRNYLSFLENLKRTKTRLLNEDILKYIGKFL